MAEKSTYDFGEKKEEVINGVKVPVEFHTPKYKEAKNKAIELLNSKEYKDILLPSDFWILTNTYANKTKAMYSGLIISHDGCLKINDVLEESLKFKPECMSIDKDGYNHSLVFTYVCKEQGIYEVGEVSSNNCKNDYPYAMALKRCMDRVILKNSKIAYAGIYSDSEADEFTKKIDEVENGEEPKPKKDDFILGEPVETKLTDAARLSMCEKIWSYENNHDLKAMYEHYKVDDVQRLNDKELKEALDCLIKRYGEIEA